MENPMRYLPILLILLLAGCAGNLPKPNQGLGYVEINDQKLDVPDGVDSGLMQQLVAEFELQFAQRQPSAPPTQHRTPDTEVDGMDMWVFWEYGVTGDYDQNGEVNVADITPIAIDFQASDADPDWDNHRMADGDDNGEVNLSDITQIVINFGDTLGQYILESAPGTAGPWTEIGRYDLAYGVAPAGGGRLEFDVLVPGGTALVYQYIWTETPGGGGNQAPTAGIQADMLSGAAPYTVNFNSIASTDDVAIVSRAWDLDGDGIFAEVRNGEAGFNDNELASYTYEWAGEFQAQVLVRDAEGLTDTATVTVSVSGDLPTRLQRFNSINHFMYQIQELDAPGAVGLLAATHYDLLVLEPTNTNVGQESFDAAAAVAQRKASPDSRGGTKLVLAYIDIGEAEDYRSYWDPGWTAPADRDTPGTPDWLVTTDPDGWEGNYPVAFWRSEWEDIVIYNADSLLNNAIDSGFQGIYMDWVEGYDDFKVDAVFEGEFPEDNIADAMVNFISNIRTAARLRDPDFLVIQQNAPYLIDHATVEADWLAVVDGIAFEDTWFSGAGDGVWNDPGSGDTPNTDTAEYSTANRIIQSQRLLGLGIPVWTVDYCLPLPFKIAPPENFQQVYANSNSAGFIPLCTQVGLEKITTTPPPWY